MWLTVTAGGSRCGSGGTAAENDSAEAIGASLAHCHRVLAHVDVDLRPWTKLTKARERLSDVEASTRALLARYLTPPSTQLRPIHGDAHTGNVLPGPAWHDWEDAQFGCVESDLACVVTAGRVLGTDFSHGEPRLPERAVARLDWLGGLRA